MAVQYPGVWKAIVAGDKTWGTTGLINDAHCRLRDKQYVITAGTEHMSSRLTETDGL